MADLALNESNPRRIEGPAREQLGESMREVGDLGGIILNLRSHRSGWPKGSTPVLAGGNQRRTQLPDDAVVRIVERFKPPTPAGTVALGFVSLGGELFSYREVEWSPEVEAQAMVRANVPAGAWDEPKLADMLARLQEGDRLERTGFTAEQLAALREALTPADTNAWGAAAGGLSGDREPFRQITFTLHDSQAELVERALELAKDGGDFEGPNSNSNGNAIARICAHYTEGTEDG